MATPIAMMGFVSALLNDTTGAVFTSTVQLPYFNMALRELKEQMQQHNVAKFNAIYDTSVPAGTLGIGGAGQPALPTGLVEIRELLERNDGSTDAFISMSRQEFLPAFEVQTSALVYWAWQNQAVVFIGATSDREVRFEYIGDSIADINSTTSTTALAIINCDSYLQYRTAGLCAQFIGENIERAADLNTMAQLALDRFLSINIKGKQAMPVRRRPFRAGWRNQGIW